MTESARHDFHVVYARMGIEKDVVQVRLRFFLDDLELGLRLFAGEPDFQLAVEPRSDSLVTAYVNDRFRVTAITSKPAALLPGLLATSGEEFDGPERIWWYVFSYQADEIVTGVDVHNTLLTELWDDQRNILRIQAFPSEKQQTYYMSGEDPDGSFRL